MKPKFPLRYGTWIAGFAAFAAVLLFAVVTLFSYSSDKHLIDQWDAYMTSEEELFRLRLDANRLEEMEHRLSDGSVRVDEELRGAGEELLRVPSMEALAKRRMILLREARQNLLSGRGLEATKVLQSRELDLINRDLRERSFEYEVNERNRLQEKFADRLVRQARILDYDVLGMFLAFVLFVSASVLIVIYIRRLRSFDRDLVSARNEAERASRLKSAFLANMSHEIRTPLNGVLGLTRLLRETHLSTDQEEIVSSLEASGRTLLALVNDILDLSKIESGKIEVVKEPFDVSLLLEDLARAFRPAADRKRLLFLVEGPPVGLGVNGDVLKIRQILQNLISNAIKFTKEGEIRVRCRRDGGRIRFEVKDTGPGIAEEARERIFRPFEQADSSTSRSHGGSGLGLAICRNLVSAMGGRLSVQSQPGLGSLFWFDIPFEPVSLPPPVASSIPVSPTLAPATGSRILLVEDNQVNAHLVDSFLKRRGYIVDVAEDGEKALEMARRQMFDLVLMDVHLPGKDGLETTRDLRDGAAGPGNARVPIVALTASAIKGEREKCLAAGMNEFLTKPVDLDLLEKTVKMHVISNLSSAPMAMAVGASSTLGPSPSHAPIFHVSAGSTGSGSTGGRRAPDLDDDLRQELLQIFKRVMPERLEQMRIAVTKSDWKAAGKIAHTMKSSAAQLGFFDLADLCKRLEAKGFAGDGANWPTEVAALEQACAAVTD